MRQSEEEFEVRWKELVANIDKSKRIIRRLWAVSHLDRLEMWLSSSDAREHKICTMTQNKCTAVFARDGSTDPPFHSFTHDFIISLFMCVV